MAKTESTAVNELIDLVQNNKQAPAEPAADLFSAPAPQATRVSPPRMTSPVPAMRGAGEVAPLPRGRAPHATSQQGMPAVPAVRISTSDPNLASTIPPLSRPSQPRASSPVAPPRRTPRSTGSVPAHRATSAPPVPARRAASAPPPPTPRATTMPPLPQRVSAQVPVQQRPTVPSVPSLPPPTAPVAAPFEVPQQFPVIQRPPTVDRTGDVVRADHWFESTAAVAKTDHTDGTAIVKRQHAETLSLIKKLILPSLIVAIIGALIGAYIAFDAQGGEKKKSVASEQNTRVEMAVTPTPSAAAAATPETAADVASVEPPTKAEEVAKAQEAAKAEAANSESMIPAATAAVINPTAAAAAEARASAPAATPTPAAPAPAPAPAPAAAAVAAAAPEAPTPAKAVATSTAPAPVREVLTTRGVVKLVDVRIDSTPSGATVMLVDNGKTSFLGSTPLATSLDPSRKYDVIFTLQGRPTQMAPLDPAKTSKLEVTLGKSERTKSERSKKSSRSAAANPLGDVVETPKAEKVEKAEKAEKAEKTEKAEKPAKAAAEPAGEGTLMVSSKPPCEIVIDGKPTGLTTPQRSIPLSAGTHKVTFVNATEASRRPCR